MISFLFLDTYMQRAKKTITANVNKRNMNQLNNELQDVQRIMVQNIDDVLQRGVAISDLDTKANSLSMMSQKYKKDARYLNLSQTYAKVAAAGVIVFVIFLYFWVLWSIFWDPIYFLPFPLNQMLPKNQSSHDSQDVIRIEFYIKMVLFPRLNFLDSIPLRTAR